MSGKIAKMSDIKQVLRLYTERVEHPERKMSNRAIARTLGLDKATVNKYIKCAQADPLGIPALLSMDNPELERRLCGGNPAYTDPRFIDFSSRLDYFMSELERKHMTMQQLYEEYREDYPNGYKYTQFCHHINQHREAKKPTLSLVNQHEGGLRMYVDYAGDKLQYINRETGDAIEVQVFVAVLPASDYAFVKAVPSQRKEDFISVLEDSLRFFGGAPAIVVPDNLKAAVIKCDKYGPTLNDALAQLANHHGFCVQPARPLKPRDKSNAENTVRIVYQRIYTALRNGVFFSLEELNNAILELTIKHNQKRMQQYNVSREERFLAIDKPNLRPLNPNPFELETTTMLKVALNGHVFLGADKHYYSVPYANIGKAAKVCYTATMVRIYIDNVLVATHPRNNQPGRYTTVKEHLASAHQDYVSRSPEYYKNRAKKASEPLYKVFCAIFDNLGAKPPETVYKTCDGLLRYQRDTDQTVFDMACEIAIEQHSINYTFIQRLIRSKCSGFIDAEKPTDDEPTNTNLRGRDYYKQLINRD